MCWCCWPFVDAWLEDPIEEASKRSKYRNNVIHIPPRPAKSFRSSKRKTTNSERAKVPAVKAESDTPLKEKDGGNDWVSIQTLYNCKLALYR